MCWSFWTIGGWVFGFFIFRLCLRRRRREARKWHMVGIWCVVVCSKCRNQTGWDTRYDDRHQLGLVGVRNDEKLGRPIDMRVYARVTMATKNGPYVMTYILPMPRPPPIWPFPSPTTPRHRRRCAPHRQYTRCVGLMTVRTRELGSSRSVQYLYTYIAFIISM